MEKEDIYKFIEDKNIWFQLTEHEAVYNMVELSKIEVLYPDCDAKNLFIRDDKKKNYYLISVKGDKKVDLKKFKNTYNTRTLSFASEADLWKILYLKPGSVSPLGLLNDNELKVTFCLDKEFLSGKGLIGVHPNDNTATLWLKTTDLLDIIKEHGNLINIVEI